MATYATTFGGTDTFGGTMSLGSSLDNGSTFGGSLGMSMGSSMGASAASAGSVGSAASAQSAISAASIQVSMTDIASWSSFRRLMYALVRRESFSWCILSIIFLNTVLITVQTNTSTEQAYGYYFSIIDNVFFGIYIFEASAKLYVYRLRYFQSGWNCFDFVIVVASFLDWLRFIAMGFSSVNPAIIRLIRVFRAVRALRALRVLRSISFLRNLQLIVQTVLQSVPALASIFILILLIMYIFAVIARQQFSDLWPERFGTMSKTFMALFQLVTLDDWYDYMDYLQPLTSTAGLYLIAYIILQSFVLVNLFMAVIVNNLEVSLNRLQSTSKRKQRKLRQRQRRDAAAMAGLTGQPVQGADGGDGADATNAPMIDPATFANLAALESMGSLDAAALQAVTALAQVQAPPTSHDAYGALLGAFKQAVGVSSGARATVEAGFAPPPANAAGVAAKRNAEFYFGPGRHLPRERQLLGHFYLLLNSIEAHLDAHQGKMKLLDDLVEIAAADNIS
jgi:hypothetical protein